MRPDAYTHVVTFLCSTMPEYIESDDRLLRVVLESLFANAGYAAAL